MNKALWSLTFLLFLGGSAYATQVKPTIPLLSIATDDSGKVKESKEAKPAVETADVELDVLSKVIDTEDEKDAQVRYKSIFDDLVVDLEKGEHASMPLSLLGTLADRGYFPAMEYVYKQHENAENVTGCFKATERLCRYYADRNDIKMAMHYANILRTNAEKHMDNEAALHGLDYLAVKFLTVPEALYARVKAGYLLAKYYQHAKRFDKANFYADGACPLAEQLLKTVSDKEQCQKTLSCLGSFINRLGHVQAHKLYNQYAVIVSRPASRCACQ